MTGDEPTNGEISRRLDQTTRTLADLATRLETGYVRRETYQAEREADRATVATIVEDRKADTAWKRQVTLALGVGAIGWLITIAIALSAFLGAR